MEVNDALIDNLSNLARLEFNAADKEEIRKDLQRMILFVEKLGELDTTGVEPLLHMSPKPMSCGKISRRVPSAAKRPFPMPLPPTALISKYRK
jgi:hypothetical protein